MKKLTLLLTLLVIACAMVDILRAQAIPADSLFLGQARPNGTPKIFTVPFTSGLRPVERIAITTDGKEIYYGELNTYPPTVARIKCLKYVDNKWQGPTNVFEGYMGPKLSVNDSIIYMQNDEGRISTTWYATRTANGWSEPKKLLSLTESTHYFQTSALNNSFCSTNQSAITGNRDLCRFVINGADTTLQFLGAPVNSADDENDFFVAKDESFIIFSRSNSSTAGDMFITYKKPGGLWTNPKKIGAPISTPSPVWEYGQFVTDDNKYLFFTRGGNQMSSYYIYWVKIDNIIDSLKHTNYVPYLKYPIPAMTISLGKEFAYTISDSTFIDDDGNNTLIYSAMQTNGSPLPAWLLFNPQTRKFSGVPDSTGTLAIRVTVKDSANISISSSFSISVVDPNNTGQLHDGQGKALYLCQNYPNPFNPSTTIRFSLPQREHVRLSILDLIGREVSVLIDRELESREHSVVFNANSIASGMYFYCLKAGNYVQQKQMIVLK